MQKMLDDSDQTTDEDLLNALIAKVNEIYAAKEELVGHDAFAAFGRSVLLQVIDQLWRQHIAALDALRQGIYLRGYAQKQPKQEYKREAFGMFEQLLDSIRETLVSVLMRVEIRMPEEAQNATAEANARGSSTSESARIAESGGSMAAGFESLSPEEQAELFAHVGRNDPCPCGSGRKFKDCPGRLCAECGFKSNCSFRTDD